jgi:hypothetical protein
MEYERSRVQYEALKEATVAIEERLQLEQTNAGPAQAGSDEQKAYDKAKEACSEKKNATRQILKKAQAAIGGLNEPTAEIQAAFDLEHFDVDKIVEEIAKLKRVAALIEDPNDPLRKHFAQKNVAKENVAALVATKFKQLQVRFADSACVAPPHFDVVNPTAAPTMSATEWSRAVTTQHALLATLQAGVTAAAAALAAHRVRLALAIENEKPLALTSLAAPFEAKSETILKAFFAIPARENPCEGCCERFQEDKEECEACNGDGYGYHGRYDRYSRYDEYGGEECTCDDCCEECYDGCETFDGLTDFHDLTDFKQFVMKQLRQIERDTYAESRPKMPKKQAPLNVNALRLVADGLHPYASALTDVLSQIHPDLKMSDGAANQLSQCLELYLKQFVAELMKQHQPGSVATTITVDDCVAAVSKTLSPELSKHAVSEGTKYAEGRSRSPSCFSKKLVCKQIVNANLAPEAETFVVALLEYVAAEILELSGNAAKDEQNNLVNEGHLQLATKGDDELETLTRHLGFDFNSDQAALDFSLQLDAAAQELRYQSMSQGNQKLATKAARKSAPAIRPAEDESDEGEDEDAAYGPSDGNANEDPDAEDESRGWDDAAARLVVLIQAIGRWIEGNWQDQDEWHERDDVDDQVAEMMKRLDQVGCGCVVAAPDAGLARGKNVEYFCTAIKTGFQKVSPLIKDFMDAASVTDVLPGLKAVLQGKRKTRIPASDGTPAAAPAEPLVLVQARCTHLRRIGEHGAALALAKELGWTREVLSTLIEADRFAEAVLIATKVHSAVHAPTPLEYSSFVAVLGGKLDGLLQDKKALKDAIVALLLCAEAGLCTHTGKVHKSLAMRIMKHAIKCTDGKYLAALVDDSNRTNSLADEAIRATCFSQLTQWKWDTIACPPPATLGVQSLLDQESIDSIVELVLKLLLSSQLDTRTLDWLAHRFVKEDRPWTALAIARGNMGRNYSATTYAFPAERYMASYGFNHIDGGFDNDEAEVQDSTSGWKSGTQHSALHCLVLTAVACSSGAAAASAAALASTAAAAVGTTSLDAAAERATPTHEMSEWIGDAIMKAAPHVHKTAGTKEYRTDLLRIASDPACAQFAIKLIETALDGLLDVTSAADVKQFGLRARSQMQADGILRLLKLPQSEAALASTVDTALAHARDGMLGPDSAFLLATYCSARGDAEKGAIVVLDCLKAQKELQFEDATALQPTGPPAPTAPPPSQHASLTLLNRLNSALLVPKDFLASGDPRSTGSAATAAAQAAAASGQTKGLASTPKHRSLAISDSEPMACIRSMVHAADQAKLAGGSLQPPIVAAMAQHALEILVRSVKRNHVTKPSIIEILKLDPTISESELLSKFIKTSVNVFCGLSFAIDLAGIGLRAANESDRANLLRAKFTPMFQNSLLRINSSGTAVHVDTGIKAVFAFCTDIFAIVDPTELIFWVEQRFPACKPAVQDILMTLVESSPLSVKCVAPQLLKRLQPQAPARILPTYTRLRTAMVKHGPEFFAMISEISHKLLIATVSPTTTPAFFAAAKIALDDALHVKGSIGDDCVAAVVDCVKKEAKKLKMDIWSAKVKTRSGYGKQQAIDLNTSANATAALLKKLGTSFSSQCDAFGEFASQLTHHRSQAKSLTESFSGVDAWSQIQAGFGQHMTQYESSTHCRINHSQICTMCASCVQAAVSVGDLLTLTLLVTDALDKQAEAKIMLTEHVRRIRLHCVRVTFISEINRVGIGWRASCKIAASNLQPIVKFEGFKQPRVRMEQFVHVKRDKITGSTIPSDPVELGPWLCSRLPATIGPKVGGWVSGDWVTAEVLISQLTPSEFRVESGLGSETVDALGAHALIQSLLVTTGSNDDASMVVDSDQPDHAGGGPANPPASTVRNSNGRHGNVELEKLGGFLPIAKANRLAVFASAERYRTLAAVDGIPRGIDVFVTTKGRMASSNHGGGEVASPSAPTPKWETAKAPDGNTYWFNRVSGDSRWTDPTAAAPANAKANVVTEPDTRCWSCIVKDIGGNEITMNPSNLQRCDESDEVKLDRRTNALTAVSELASTPDTLSAWICAAGTDEEAVGDRGAYRTTALSLKAAMVNGAALQHLSDTDIDAIVRISTTHNADVGLRIANRLRALRNMLLHQHRLRRPLMLPPPIDDTTCPGAPTVNFVVLGNTGAGKSTLLNAMLGEVQVLPTNCMRACTATVIELGLLKSTTAGVVYSAEVEFLTRAEFAAEIDELLVLANYDSAAAKARANGGRGPGVAAAAKEDEMLERARKDALEKLKSIFGSRFELVKPNTPAAADLAGSSDGSREHIDGEDGGGGKVVFHEATAEGMGERLAKYVDSANDTSDGGYWPLIKRVAMHGPWSACFSDTSFVKLVDAPGLHDDNAARAAAIDGVLRATDGVVLVSNCNRAVRCSFWDILFHPRLLLDPTAAGLKPAYFKPVYVYFY